MGTASRLRAAVTAGAAFLVVGSACAREVFVVRFNTLRSPAFAEPPCTFLSYRDDIVLWNPTVAEKTVRLIGVSNGATPVALPLTIPPGQVRTSEGDEAAFATWAPTPQPLLWVAHLDLPDGVQIVSRLLVPTFASAGCDGGSGGALRTYAGIPMPVIDALSPPSSPQIHLATDIGGNGGGTADDGRTNVGIYNGGTITAHAIVELRRACDGGVIDTVQTEVPANSISQVTGLSAAFNGCTAIHAGTYESYVVVTVDQPSFSYAITLSNQRPPWLPVSSSP
jgi:hypothetical protein